MKSGAFESLEEAANELLAFAREEIL